MASTSGFPRLCAHSRTGRGSIESHGAVFRGRRPQGTALGAVRGPPISSHPQGFAPFPTAGASPSTWDAPSQHSPKFPRGFLPRSLHGENREQRLCSGAGEHPAEFVSIRSQNVGSHILRSRAQLGGPRVVPSPPGPARHYTYCFLEAELPGRLHSFSSRAGASGTLGT